ncbi:hypothetical protein MPTK1_8g14750 [Marchantia polymorpha subsp. ruderalis]|uniref:Uncharacterized protein n=1 Tax=Marchantia polymorpha TaxID=3197 RepID=A0A2R6W524_MARPO|nr:hypothetical protein MARPO_0151s0031 [Marchantia polymorpha]BBN19906.1 hypothetical protein Mp_8g14750 [Marchantia polymorpha subsp. ruderalis]|eukprot:PTQ28958.1 hypothetical protein MARPO_0151s0031 [Marchantia polymorpha]
MSDRRRNRARVLQISPLSKVPTRSPSRAARVRQVFPGPRSCPAPSPSPAPAPALELALARAPTGLPATRPGCKPQCRLGFSLPWALAMCSSASSAPQLWRFFRASNVVRSRPLGYYSRISSSAPPRGHNGALTD